MSLIRDAPSKSIDLVGEVHGLNVLVIGDT